MDENDNDLQSFLKYFIAAIQQKIPSFGKHTLNLLSTPSLLPTDLLTNSIINDLNELNELFVLVFDDIYLVNNLDIYKLLSTLLKFPPQNFHLVLISRSDPPLPLAKLRASNKIKEVRIMNLQFTDKETEVFVKKYFKIDNTNSIVSLLKQKTEGWPTGLRLAMIHISYHYKDEKDIEKYLKGLNFSETYFIEEVLNNLDSITVEFLLKTSILDKFCPALTNHLLAQSNEIIDSNTIIKELRRNNLFIVNLDDENNWFRYHHLFQSLLRKELKNRYSQELIIQLHRNALEWYENALYINDALFHANQTNDMEITTRIIVEHMHKPLNENKWFYLEQWLTKIPDNYIYQSPALLIAQMWIFHHRNMIWLIPEILNKLEKIRTSKNLDTEIELQLQFFQGVILFWSAQINDSLLLFDYIRKNLSSDKIGAISLATIYYASAAQMNGNGEEVYLELKRKVYTKNLNPTFKTILFGSLLYIKLQEGALFTVEQINYQLKEYSLSTQDIFSQTWSNYFFGYVAFQQDKLELAYDYFKESLENVYFLNMLASVDCFAGMLLTLKALDKQKEYKKVYNQLLAFINERNNPAYSTIAFSLRARLSLLESDLTTATKYIKMADMHFDSGNTQFYIESPRLTYCNVLLAHNDDNKTEEAIANLESHLELANNTHNEYQLIRINILLAIAFMKTNNSQKAKEALSISLDKAQANNWIRPFIEDKAEEIAELLAEFISNNKHVEFTSLLLSKLSKKDDSSKDINKDSQSSFSNNISLTNRELDIIHLLAKRLSNKEIASKLFISNSTVKRHTINIYQKLGVNKRRDAVQKAVDLELLS